MKILGALLIFASQSAALGTPFEGVSPEAAAERISACGLGHVTLKYDELLQSKTLSALDGKVETVTDEQLSCADIAASYYNLELSAPFQARYNAIRQGRLNAHFLAEARAWLSERRMLDQVPHYEEGVTPDADFAEAAERICGPQAKGALHSDYGFHAIGPDWVLRRLTLVNKSNSDTFACILNVARVAGYELHLIGNAAFSDEGN